jgi:hypothetical protein
VAGPAAVAAVAVAVLVFSFGGVLVGPGRLVCGGSGAVGSGIVGDSDECGGGNFDGDFIGDSSEAAGSSSRGVRFRVLCS